MSTGENVQKWTRYFLLFFSDASERQVWLNAESKILASTFGRFRLYRLKLWNERWYLGSSWQFVKKHRKEKFSSVPTYNGCFWYLTFADKQKLFEDHSFFRKYLDIDECQSYLWFGIIFRYPRFSRNPMLWLLFHSLQNHLCVSKK